MEIKSTAYVFLILTTVLGPMMPVMLAIAGQTANIYEFLFLAYLIAVPASLAVVFATKKQHRLIGYLKNKRDFGLICIIGLLNYALLEFGTTYAEKFISVALVTVVYRSWPLIMLIFLPFLLRERISRYQMAALMVGFLCLFLSFAGGGLGVLNSNSIVIIIFLVGIAVTSALAAVLAKKYAFDTTSSIFIFSVANLVVFGALFLASGAPFTFNIPTSGLIAILYIGIAYNVLVAIMYYSALRTLKTTIVANTIFFGPFITFVYAFLVLGQPFSIYYIGIALLVSFGLVLQRFDTKGGTYKAKSSSREHVPVIFDVTSAFINTKAEDVHRAIISGGKVLAIKVHESHLNEAKRLLGEALSKETASKIVTYFDTDVERISEQEARFVAELLGKNNDEHVLMSAGNPDESERLFGSLGIR